MPSFDDLAARARELLALIEAADSLDDLRQSEPALVGKRSSLAAWQRSLGSLDASQRADAGARLQEVRRQVEAAFVARREELERRERAERLALDRLDLGDVVVRSMRAPLRAGHPGWWR